MIASLNFMLRVALIPRGKGGGGGYFTKFNTGRLCPEVHLLTLLYTILQKRYPFNMPFIEKRYPFHITTLENCTPFLNPYNEVSKQYYGKISSIILIYFNLQFNGINSNTY